MPTAADLTEAFLWSEYRVVTKTATVSLHGNTFQVDQGLVGRKSGTGVLPFEETVEVRYHDKVTGKAAHNITRTRASESPTRNRRGSCNRQPQGSIIYS